MSPWDCVRCGHGWADHPRQNDCVESECGCPRWTPTFVLADVRLTPGDHAAVTIAKEILRAGFPVQRAVDVLEAVA